MDTFSLLRLLSLSHRNDVAVSCKGLEVTYGKFISDAKTLSIALKQLGVKKGDIVAIDMPNIYQALVAFFACNRIGIVTTYLNYFSGKEEKCKYLNKFKSPVIINYDRTMEHNEYLKTNSGVSYIITLSKDRINDLTLNDAFTDEPFVSFNSLKTLADSCKNRIQFPCKAKDNALILFTSGTTGNPKSVVLTNENVIASLIYAKNTGDWNSVNAKKLLVCVPFS